MPGVLPAFANAGCMTADCEFLVPCEEAVFVFVTGANPVVRPLVVAPKQSCFNEIINNRQLPFQQR